MKTEKPDKSNEKINANASPSTLHATKHHLDVETRRTVVEILNNRLADGIDLFFQLRTAHFNVKGPSFGALHELFEKAYDFVDESNDLIAERAVQLGGVARSTIRIAVERSNLKEYPTDLVAGLDHCEAVSDRLAAYGKLVRKAIDDTDEAGDADTSDMLTDISRGIDKFLWMVEAHTQADR